MQNIEQQKAAKRKFNDCWRWWQILISSINEVATIIFFLVGHLKGLSAQINKNENQLAGKIKKLKTQFIKSSNIVNTGTNLNNLKLFRTRMRPILCKFWKLNYNDTAFVALKKYTHHSLFVWAISDSKHYYCPEQTFPEIHISLYIDAISAYLPHFLNDTK